MKKPLLVVLLAFGLTFVCRLMAQDLLLHYNRPAEYFEEALVIGNGTMGGIVYGGTTVDRISLNDITFWTGEPERKVYSPEAYKAASKREQTSSLDLPSGSGFSEANAIPEIRTALDNEDYELANKLQRKVQGHYSENYQPLGELLIIQGATGEVTDYQRWLDISDATAHTLYKRGGHEYRTDYFASHPDQGLVIRLTTTAPEGLDVKLNLSTKVPHSVKVEGDDYVMEGYTAYHSLPSYTSAKDKFEYDENRGIHFCTRMKINRVSKQEWIVYLVNATSFNGFDKDPVREGRDYKAISQRLIDEIVQRPYDDLLSRHTEDYKSIFDRVKLTLGAPQPSPATPSPLGEGWGGAPGVGATTDVQLRNYLDENLFNPALEALYFQYGRYLLISCSRTENVPANLQGLWNESLLPPWSCNYTSNINLEENYWPAETANMPEMHRSLLTFMKELQGSGEKTAKAYYGVDKGWCLAHNTDIWAMTNPVGMNSGDPSWANWNMGGAWVSTHIWEHYSFSLDKDFLREYYPVLKGAAEFCMGWLTEKNGVLMTSPSTSPENIFVTDKGYHGATCYGGSADIAMIRECLIATKNSAQELGTDKALIAQIDNTLARLMPYKIGERGNLQEWYHDWADEHWDHRHQSHLFGLYPGHNLADGRHSVAELKKAAARSLEIKGDKTTGWSTGWRVNLFARLGDAENAYHIYRKLLSYVSPDKYKGPDARRGGGTYPNLLDAHSPFQIDGNFGGCAGVVEMLMQSEWGKQPVITLLPALPDNWKDGAVSGIRARGGFTVDMQWRDKRVTALTIHSLRPGRLTLVSGGKTRTVKVKRGENKIPVIN